MSPEIKTEDLREIQSAVTALREDIENKNMLTKEEKKKINDLLDNYETKNQEFLKEQKAQEAKQQESAEKIEMLEQKIVDMSLYNKNIVPTDKIYKNSPEYKALNFLCSNGENKAWSNAEYKDYLRTDISDQGGFLVPEQMANVILKEIEEISPVRQFARKWGAFAAKTIRIPVRTSIPDAPYEKELEETSKSTSAYRSEGLTAYRQHTIVGATMDILNFANFDIESEIMTDASEAFAKTEGTKFILGTGVTEPEGILVNTDIQTVETAGSLAVTLDDVILLSGNLKVGYNPIYFFNRELLVHLRVQKSGTGNYLWQVGGETQPLQINGYPYAIFQDMPGKTSGAFVAGTKVVGFGDLFRAYSIYDSITMSLIRDDVTKKAQALIEFSVNRWNTGQVVIPEAIKLLKVKA